MRFRRKLLIVVAMAGLVVACGESENGTEIDSDECQDFVDTVDITDDIESDRTLESDTRYVVTDNVTVEARLTIEPGTCTEFESGARLRFRDGGILVADGEPDAQIVFTGTTEDPGWWDSLRFRGSDHPDNVIDHAVIEYAGGGDPGAGGEPANVVIGSDVNESELTITNTTIRHSETEGLTLHSSSDLAEFADNTVTDNADYPVRVGAHHLYHFDSSSSYAGNGTDFVYGEGNDVEDEGTWENLDVPYELSGTTELSDGGKLTIEPGAELQFRQDSQMKLRGDGSLNAEGTDDDPIVFTATEETDGWWHGLYFRASFSPDNVLEHAVVEYAGGGGDRHGVEAANIMLGSGVSEAQLQMSDSIIRNSAEYGLYVNSSSTVNSDICDVNTFEDNVNDDCLLDG